MQEFKLASEVPYQGVVYDKNTKPVVMLGNLEFDESISFVSKSVQVETQTSLSIPEIKDSIHASVNKKYSFNVFSVDKKNLVKVKNEINKFTSTFLSGAYHDYRYRTNTDRLTSFFIRNLNNGGAICVYVMLPNEDFVFPNTFLDQSSDFAYKLERLGSLNVEKTLNVEKSFSLNQVDSHNFVQLITDSPDDKYAMHFKRDLDNETQTRNALRERKQLNSSIKVKSAKTPAAPSQIPFKI